MTDSVVDDCVTLYVPLFSLESVADPDDVLGGAKEV